MYARCLIVILVVALAQIFPTGIEACQKFDRSYVDIRSCHFGAKNIPSCCQWCKQWGKPECHCKFIAIGLTIGCECKD